MIAAHNLKRKFVGIDLSLYTVQSVVRVWLTEIGLGDIQIAGIPEDLASARQLAVDDPFEFESFAIELCHPAFVANKEQRKDGGTDGKGWLLQPVKECGRVKDLVVAQVKAGKPTLSQVRDFAHVIQSTEGSVAGVFITLEKAEKHWTNGMRQVAYQMGTFKHEHSMEEFERLQHWHVGQFFYKSARQRLPHLPELADRDGKALREVKVTVEQLDFWRASGAGI